MKKLWIVLMMAALLPTASFAEGTEWVREPAAKKENVKKKKKKAKKASSKGKKAKASAAKKKQKAKNTHRSHAPQAEASDIGEIPEHLKDDLPPPNNGDLTE